MLSVVGLFNLIGAVVTAALVFGVLRSKPDFSLFDEQMNAYLLLRGAVVLTLLCLFALRIDLFSTDTPYLAVFRLANSFIETLTFFIHEAGHVYFGFFGRFIQSLGGTLNEIIIPLIFCALSLYQGAPLAASTFLFWIGHNFIGISLYIADARAMKLSLMGGEGTHDWNYLLGALTWLRYDHEFSAVVEALGITIMVISITALVFSGPVSEMFTRRGPESRAFPSTLKKD